MSKRSFLYSAAFIGLVAAGGAAIQPAQAQKGIALQPSTQWAVNKVDTSSDGNGYCAVARRFRPNTILTFARNANDETSFALDFQTPRFRQAEAMEVMIDPGAGQERAFEVYPVSNQAFVIRLGQDEAFFNAIEKTGFLRVAFGDKAYHFDLSDIDTGQEKLASCVAATIMPAAGYEDHYAAAAPVEAVESENGEFERDVNDLRRQLAKLQSDNRRMTGRAEAAASGGEVDPERVAMLEQENRDLQNKLRDINNGNTESIRSKKDVLTIERLRMENEQLSAALETQQAGDIQGEVLYEQVAALQEENERLHGNQTVEGDASGVDPDDILSLIQENERLKEEITLKSADSDRGDALRAIIDRLEQENAELKTGTVASAENEKRLADSREQLDTLKKENKRLQSVVEASEITGDAGFIVKELKNKVETLSADMQAKEGKLVEMSKLTTEVQLLKATNEELEKQLIESALRGPVHARAATHKVAGLETQNDSLLQKIQSESDTAAAADASSIEGLKVENEQLKKTIADGQTLVEENKKLQGEVESLRKENEELKASASAAPQGDLAAELQKAKDDNETLRVQLQEKENELRELTSLREEVQRLRTENEQLKAGGGAETVNSPIPGGAPNPEVDNLTHENENLRQQIANMNTGAKDTEIAELKAKLQEQEAKIAAADEAAKKAEESAKAAKNEAKAAQKKAEERKAAEAKAAEAKVEDPKAAEAVASPTDELLAAPGGQARAETPAEQGVSPAPAPPVPANSPAIEQEMIVLERKLSEAKASGDQMAIQQAARDYMNLKSKLTASQELAAAHSASGPDQASDLLAFDGTGQAQVIHIDEQAGVPVNEAQAQEENMRMSASEDPFAEVKVEDDFQGYESVRGGTVKEQGQEQIPTPAEVSNNVAPPPSAGWGQTTSASPNTASHGGVYSPAVGVPQILGNAGIVSPEAVNVVTSASGSDKVAYQWKSDKVYGSAIQRPLSDPSRFESQVQEYLAQTKKRCGHDFAAVADGSTEQNGTRIDTYEIACVGTGVNSSASLVFFNKGDTFTVLAHEAPADDLESAMDIRDRLVKAIGGS
ncbi:MAG: hypothetical protein WBK55_00455 [Alphaproteobacteria bacterium]